MFINTFERFTNCECGLIFIVGSKPVAIPLSSVKVSATIIDGVAEVHLDQTYVNKESIAVEATYMFPLDEAAAVFDFKAELEGNTVVAKVKEREEARKEYEEALEEGNTAFILEEKKPDIFQVKLGNLNPGASCKLSIKYITELKAEGSSLRFYIPSTIAPRYVPASDKSEEGAKIGSIPYSSESPCPMEINVTCRMSSKITKLSSPSHSIKTKIEETDAEVELSGQTTDMDKDFVLLVDVENPRNPHLYVETNSEGSVAAMIKFLPFFELDTMKTELIFLVDRSGSMGGEQIQKAGEALSLFLHSLPTDCYFNIIGFGSSFKGLFEVSKKYDDDTLRKAERYAKCLDASFGGTEILRPLERILEEKLVTGYQRQVIVLTDGQVSNTNAVISLVARNAHKMRVLTLGLGNSVSHDLVEGLARAGRGKAVFSSIAEELRPKVLQLLKNALQPALCDTTIAWKQEPKQGASKPEVSTEKSLIGYGKPKKPVPEVSEVERSLSQVPSKVPAIFDGELFTVICKLPKETVLDEVVVSTESPDGTLSLPLKVSKCSQGELIHRFWARKKIRELDQQMHNVWSDNSVYKEIVSLAMQYNLASSKTSFVGVSENSKKPIIHGKRDIPNQYSDRHFALYAATQNRGMNQCDFMGWRGMPSPPRAKAMSCLFQTKGMNQCHFMNTRGIPSPPRAKAMCSSPDYVINSSVIPLPRRAMATCGFSSDEEMTFGSKQLDDSFSSPPPPPPPAKSLDLEGKLSIVIDHQSFNGKFVVGSEILELLQVSEEDYSQAQQSSGFSKELWDTAVCLRYMELQLQPIIDDWMLIAKKGTDWLKTTSSQYEKVLEEAEKFLKQQLSTS